MFGGKCVEGSSDCVVVIRFFGEDVGVNIGFGWCSGYGSCWCGGCWSWCGSVGWCGGGLGVWG